MFRSVPSLLLSLATGALALGCGGQVLFDEDAVDGSGGGRGDPPIGEGVGGDACGGDFCGEGGGGPVPVPPFDGIAETWPVVEAWGYAPAPRDTLLLALSSQSLTCGVDPITTLPACEERLAWLATIPLPRELQNEGALVELDELLGTGPGAFYSESQQGSDGTCSGGGGTLTGTLEVLAVADDSLTIRLSSTSAFTAPLDGEWRLSRCPGGDDPAPGP
jgi:hypothetical protein